MRRFEGKVVLVTGGTSGIGEATVKRFVNEGAKVAFTGRRKEHGIRLSEATQALFIETDHTVAEQCNRCIQETLRAFGKLDILFNNAGVVLLHSIDETTDEVWERTIQTNITAVWRMSKLALPALASSKGCIINNASDWGLVAASNACAYCVSKAAIVQMTKCFALECIKESSVRTNCICPGDTFVQRWMIEGRDDVVEKEELPIPDEKEIERRLRTNDELPMGRVADVNEIVSAVLFLASSEASYINGVALPIDGGNSCK